MNDLTEPFGVDAMEPCADCTETPRGVCAWHVKANGWDGSDNGALDAAAERVPWLLDDDPGGARDVAAAVVRAYLDALDPAEVSAEADLRPGIGAVEAADVIKAVRP